MQMLEVEIRDMTRVRREGSGMLEHGVLSICIGLVPYLEEHQRLRAR